MYKVKETVELYPFGHNCKQLTGEVSKETYDYLIESGKATAEDFDLVGEVKTKKTKQK